MKKFRIEIKWALVFIASILIWMLGERLSGLHDRYIEQHAIFTNFFGIVAIAIYLLALYDKRRNYYGGLMSWKQGFKSGLVLTLFITLLVPLSQLVISYWIAPDYFENMIEYSVSTGKMTQEEAEGTFNLFSYVWQSTAFAFISGIITAGIAALFTRKKEKQLSSKRPDLTGI